MLMFIRKWENICILTQTVLQMWYFLFFDTGSVYFIVKNTEVERSVLY